MDFLKNNKLPAALFAAFMAALVAFYAGLFGDAADQHPADLHAAPQDPSAPVGPAQPQEQAVPNFGAPTDAPAAESAPVAPSDVPAAPALDAKPATG